MSTNEIAAGNLGAGANAPKPLVLCYRSWNTRTDYSRPLPIRDLYRSPSLGPGHKLQVLIHAY